MRSKPYMETRIPAEAADVRHVDQYLGVWAMVPDRLEQLMAHVRAMQSAGLVAHIEAARQHIGVDPEPEPLYEVDDGVAVIRAEGTVTKYGSSLSPFPGTVGLRQAVRAASNDSHVRATMIRTASPGGSVAGVSDLAAEVRRAAAVKPVAVHGEDMVASAAYWLGSGASRLSASSGTMVGSIGVYAVVSDLSALYAREGVRPIIVKSGKFKGAGVEGTEVDAEQIQTLQAEVDAVADHFIDDVARGRPLAKGQVRELADGRIHIAKAAQEMGLLDAVEDFDTAMKRLRAMAKPARSARSAGSKLAAATMHEGTGRRVGQSSLAASDLRGQPPRKIASRLPTSAVSSRAK